MHLGLSGKREDEIDVLGHQHAGFCLSQPNQPTENTIFSTRLGIASETYHLVKTFEISTPTLFLPVFA